MAIAPSAAAAAYQALAKIGTGAGGASAPALGNTQGTQSFSQFLEGAVKDAVGTMKHGEQMATKQVEGKTDMVSVVGAVNAAELTLDTVVAVRDKVIQAYQNIMQMPI
ncbi:MAG: flagellar hook-basal body complex protein FliE [Alphaproteobacteria bacterium]|nr:flagellar hook-basal body complex protein FliE [Alphaproteobacteria bacterium]MBU6471030.1 flagellar hook-basal body complex protein FliE [Alphaproteobacteria bacterium]MDE2012222.1 flagellar hook-basal body complex protein FliE [Alphaproteobacteria bacterium]MDE2074867.1 flagellar hook-basal body complex protein FliE [Alphaproteobacteria bacterium]MDE2351475.1 flagellar hook-basal body complex protein FliE [Alphaproteobacteria bacterium]